MVGLRRSVLHVVGHGHLLTSGWVPLGPVRARRGSSGTRMGPYLSRTPIRVHRVFRQGSSGAIGPYRPNSGFRRVSVGTPIWHDRPRRGLTDHSTVPYRCTTKIRTPQGPYGSSRGRRGPRRDPTGPPAAGRRHRRTPFHRSSPVWGSYEALTPICLSRDLCMRDHSQFRRNLKGEI